jgi:DNA segregation ATPase FtsK/SpoIIIE-like protein
VGGLFATRPYLDRQADQIEQTLSSLKLPARVQGGQVGNNWVRYHLTPMSGTQVDQVVQAADVVAEAMGVTGLRIAEETQGMYVDVPLQRGTELRLLPLLRALPGLSELTAVVGMLTTATPLILNFSKRSTWNLIVTAPTGCGKSELLRSLMISLALTSRRSQLNLLGIDIGGHELAVIEALPHSLKDLATEPKFATELLTWLSDEIERRITSGVGKPHLALVIDDLGWITTGWEKEALSSLTMIARHGMEAGVHFIAATRTPLPRVLNDMLHCRGIVKVTSVESEINAGDMVVGRFQFESAADVSIADTAWMSLRDLDTAASLAAAGWRAIGFSSYAKVEVGG